jgi:hypothetical protein
MNNFPGNCWLNRAAFFSPYQNHTRYNPRITRMNADIFYPSFPRNLRILAFSTDAAQDDGHQRFENSFGRDRITADLEVIVQVGQ